MNGEFLSKGLCTMNVDFDLMGQKIKDARDKARLTQEQLAENVDLSVTHISAIENNNSGVSVASLVKIANELNVSLDWLLFDKTEGLYFIENEVSRLFSDCTDKEAQILLNFLKSDKEILRKYQEKQ